GSRHQGRGQGLPGCDGDGPGGVQGEHRQAVQPDARARLRAPHVRRRDRGAGHRQYVGPLHLRADARAGAAACGRDDAFAAALDDPVGVGHRRPAGDRARPGRRGVLRVGAPAGARPVHGHARLQRPVQGVGSRRRIRGHPRRPCRRDAGAASREAGRPQGHRERVAGWGVSARTHRVTGASDDRALRWAAAACALAIGALVAGCGSGTPSRHCGGTLEVMAVWTGTEQRNFSRVIAGFESATGASVSYTAAPAGVPAALDARLAAHNPPDVAFLPQPGALRRYASEGALVPLDPPTRRNVDRNYSAAWLDLASVAGRPFGVWFKAADKSLVWYNVGAFENAGVVPPTTIDGLVHVARTLTSTGVPAFSVGGANPWTLDDWFANLYLRVAGPARYDLLAAHRLAWTDESVKGTLRLMSQVLSPGALAGGPVGALGMSFSSSVAALASDPPGAAMTSEAEFVLGALPPDAAVEPGRDIDVFPFPSVAPAEPGVAAPAVAAAPS